MNDPRLIDATVLINHISVLERENEDDIEFYEFAKDLIRKAPTAYVSDKAIKDFSTWEIAPHETIPTKRFVCSACRNEVETKYYANECYFSFCPFCGSQKVKN